MTDVDYDDLNAEPCGEGVCICHCACGEEVEDECQQHEDDCQCEEDQ